MPPLRFAVRVRPGASRTAVGGVYAGPHGPALVVAVTQRAEGGRATEAALRAVAEAVGARRGDFELLVGHRSRDKIVAVDPATPAVRRRLRALLPGGTHAERDTEQA